MSTTAIYTRVARDTTGQGVERQRQACIERAASLGWEVVDTFEDNGGSAFRGAVRPGFEAMLAAAERGEIDTIVCQHADRLLRRPADLERLLDLIDNKGVKIDTDDGTDLSTPAGRLTARIAMTVLERESHIMSERIKAGKRAKRDQRANAQEDLS